MNTRKVMLLAFIVSLLVYACGPVAVTDECMDYSFECGPELAEQLTISFQGDPAVSFNESRSDYVDPRVSFNESRSIHGLGLATAEFVLYNMKNGQYTEVNSRTVLTDDLSDTDKGLSYYTDDLYIRTFGYRNITDIDDPWGLITTEGADCFGLRIVFTYDNGTIFTLLGWRDDSQAQLTQQNSVQGIAYMNKDEDFIRSNLGYADKPYTTTPEGKELHQRLRLSLSIESDGKIAASVYPEDIPYKDYIEFTGKSSPNDGDYFEDPNPSRCNIITSS